MFSSFTHLKLLTNQIKYGDRMLQEEGDDDDSKLSIEEIILQMNMRIAERNLTNAFGSIVGVAFLEELEEITDSPTAAPTISSAPSNTPTSAPTASGEASRNGYCWMMIRLCLLFLLCYNLWG